MKNIIGENLKLLREEMGFNQSNIADFLNVDQSLISKIEKGDRKPSTDMLEKLACLFGVTVDSIEKEKIETTKLLFAFRTSELSVKDMETICAINKIALNSEYMEKLLKGENND